LPEVLHRAVEITSVEREISDVVDEPSLTLLVPDFASQFQRPLIAPLSLLEFTLVAIYFTKMVKRAALSPLVARFTCVSPTLPKPFLGLFERAFVPKDKAKRV
jgi:hypothetical protein